MKFKEEEDDTIPPKSAAPAVKPEPELESEVKVEAKSEANREAGPLKAPTKRGRRMITKQPPLVGPSLAPTPRDGQETAEGRGGVPTPSESSSKITKKKGGDKGPSRAVKKAREEKWKRWCEARKWIHQHDPGYKQKVGDVVAHRSDARSYYLFKDYEIDTIPYVPFENKHNPKSFGRAYNNANLRTLISRKLAYLAGLDEQFDPETKEDEFLKEGWKLFEVDTKEREEAMKQTNKTRKPLKLWKIIPPRIPNPSTLHHHGTMKNRPFGSWSTRMYEDDEYVGDWLHFQFDPYANDFADFYGRYERFWPRGADWAWEVGGLCSCCDF
ncbi:hypothetical protein LXA43DRAFT_1100596 [Ganoderma leucocontextum]|nr:hypothetical protein LXA43DRAFT_1100596 [Ganoderma leucocontextum]